MGGSQPRLDRRKMIPNPIKMYAPIADFDLMAFSPLDEFYAKHRRHKKRSSGAHWIMV
jgi:hypothetical protein